MRYPLLVARISWSLARAAPEATLDVARDWPDELCELCRDDEFGRCARAERLERLQILQGHRLFVDALRCREDLLQRLREALGAKDCRLAVAFGLQDLRLLRALGHVDRGLARALRLGDHGSPRPLRGRRPGPRLLDVAGRGDLTDLDGGHLAAPALRDLVELDPERLVDLLALRKDLVEGDVADHGAQRRRRDAEDHVPEPLRGEHAGERV